MSAAPRLGLVGRDRDVRMLLDRLQAQETVTRATLQQYRHSEAVTDMTTFPDRGHSLTIDSGWREVADTCLTWPQKQAT